MGHLPVMTFSKQYSSKMPVSVGNAGILTPYTNPIPAYVKPNSFYYCLDNISIINELISGSISGFNMDLT
jgi:hypothetical protein